MVGLLIQGLVSYDLAWSVPFSLDPVHLYVQIMGLLSKKEQSYYIHMVEIYNKEQDKASDIEQQPPFSDKGLLLK